MSRVDHLSFAVTEIDAASRFLGEAFGYRVSFVERGMTDQIASMLGQEGARCDLVQMVKNGLPKIEFIAFEADRQERPPDRPTRPGAAHVAIATPRFDATLSRLVELGAAMLGSVTAFEAGRAAYLATPFGLFIELEEDLSAE